MSSNDPDQIRAEIDRTRRDLSHNVDALSEQVKPGNVARRQTEKVGEAVAGKFQAAKDAVMGVADDVTDRFGHDSDRPGLGERAAHLRDDAQYRAADMRDEAGYRLQQGRYQAKRKTQGNPMAAGLIALGAGWLLGSLIPSTQREQMAAAELKDRAKPLAETAGQWAKEAGEQFREPAQQAFADLKESATIAAQNVKDEGQAVASDVKAHGQEVAADVKHEGQAAAADVKDSGLQAKDDVKRAGN